MAAAWAGRANGRFCDYSSDPAELLDGAENLALANHQDVADLVVREHPGVSPVVCRSFRETMFTDQVAELHHRLDR